MRTISKISFLIAVVFLFASCEKEVETGIMSTGSFTETSAVLKDAAGFPVGAAISYTPMLNDTKYSDIVKRDFDGVTFEYHMKHGAIVQDNGSMNFTQTDALVNAVGTLNIFGHTLGWHRNQNANYLKSYAGIVIPAATELLPNNGFESGNASSFTNWSNFNTGNPPPDNAVISPGSGPSEVRTGTRSMKVFSPVAFPGNQWRVQVASDLFNTVVGRQYTVVYWVKALAAGGSIRLSTQTNGGGGPQYQGDQTIGTTFQLISWTITANSTQTRILFDMGQVANTYFIDDASAKEIITPPSGAQVAAKLDTALGNFVTGMVNRYKTKVKEWDVINELFDDNGNIRSNANTPITDPDVLVWSNYLGREFAFKAFNYASAADPTATLYINDYNLESRPAKLDSLIKFVAEMKARNVKIDGIGTQMHISWNSSYAGIDAMFQKLAATGLKIRISELDVRTVMNSAAGAPTPQLNSYQANMFQYVVSSYRKYIPAAQQAGITVWGVTDHLGWLYNNGKEFALMYDKNYQKKPSYSGFLQGLK